MDEKIKSLPNNNGNFLERFAVWATRWTGSSKAFLLAMSIIVIWVISGPLFGFSDTWQLVINTGTTIVTFLMVFLIQRMQNKDSLGIHLKLNELIASQDGASNRLINVESLSEEELIQLQVFFEQLAQQAREEMDIRKTHSIEEAREVHKRKKGRVHD